MASSNIARLGIVLGVDTAELEVKISKAKETFHGFTKQVERDSNSAAKDIVALRHATEDYGKTLTKVEQIEREIKSGRYQRAEGSLIEMLRKEAAAYDAKANAMKNMAGAQFKMNEQQKLNLTYQTTDLFTQIASGQSPFIALIQQGGQLKDSMGGVGNMFKAIGTLFTPFTVGLGAVAVAAGSVGYAFYKAADDMGKFKDAMTLTGGFSGLTYESLLKLGDTLSNKTNVAIGSARDVMQELAASGKFTGQSLEAVGSVILRFSKLTGQDAKEASASLIPLLDGTASSAKQLNDKYHFLTIEQYKQIKALEKQGKLQESILLQAKLLDKSFGDNRRELGYLETAWSNVGKAASWAWDSMMGWGRDDKAKDLQKLNQEIALATAALNAPGTRMKQTQDENKAKLDALVEQRSLLLKSMRMEEEAAKERAKIAEKNAKGIRDEDKYGPMGIAKAAELAKAKAEQEFAVAKQSANEIQILQLDAAKKLSDAQLEMKAKNTQEDNQFAQKNLEIYQYKSIAIATETAEKIKQIQIKKYMEEQEAKLAYQKEFDDEFVRKSKAREAADLGAYAKSEDLDFQRKSLELKYQLIYATETEQKLAQISLEYARKRKELESSESVTDYQRKELDRQEAMAKMFVTMDESAKRTQQVFDTVYGNMSSAIDNFVKTGKLSMKDLARSIIQDLIAIQMKAMVLRFLGGAFANMSAASTYGTMPFSEQTNMLAAQDAGFGRRASGGAVTNNTPYLVGERGPELFVPSGSGTIIPNGQVGGMGGQTINYNGPIIQNMSAIDTQSGLQFLAKNKQGVFAAYQSANRSIPVSR